MKKSNNSSVMITPENDLHPGDFPIGSLESKAAARALLARKRQAKEYRFSVVYQSMGNPDCEIEYIVNETGVVKKIGREPTMEEFAAHPFFQGCDIEALGMQRGSGVLNSTPRSEKRPQPQPQRKSEKVEESNDPPQTIGVDPLAVVHRRRFNR